MTELGADGIITILVGATGRVQEYNNHARVKFIDCKAIPAALLEDNILNRTKIVIITEGLGQQHVLYAQSWTKKHNAVWIMRKSNQAIYEFLKEKLPLDDKPVTQEEAGQDRGKLKALIPFIDWTKSNSENGRALLSKAIELGIKTTIGSTTQLVSIERRKQGRSDVPKSVRSNLDLTVEIFDKFIEELGEMRDYVIKLAEENRMLKAKLDKFKKAFEDA